MCAKFLILSLTGAAWSSHMFGCAKDPSITHSSKKARTLGVVSSSHAHVLPVSLWEVTLHSHPDYHLAWQLGSLPVPRLNLGSNGLQVSLGSFPPPPPSRVAEQFFPKKHGT